MRIGDRGDARVQLRILDGAGGGLVGNRLHDRQIGRLKVALGGVHVGLQGGSGRGLLHHGRLKAGSFGGIQGGGIVGNLFQLIKIHAGAVQQRVNALLLNANHVINVELVGYVVVVDGGGRGNTGIVKVEVTVIHGGVP